MEQPFSFKFFYTALGYHREVRKGKGVYVKRLDRKRFSVVSHEAFQQEYREVCNCMSKEKEVNIEDAK